MKQKNTVVTLALLGVLALAALMGVLLPSDSVARAQAANSPPVFPNNLDTTLEVDENTPPGVNIGAPISATDPDEDGENNDDLEFGDTLTYSLQGDSAASFEIDPLTGQLSTKAPLDYEDSVNRIYSVTVKVEDSGGGTDTVASDTQDVEITVRDIAEPPAAPFPPAVVSGEDDNGTSDVDESTTNLKVVWHPPVNTGRTDITNYDVQYKKSSAPTFTEGAQRITATTTTINPGDGLESGTSYQVRVRARNDEGTGPWSLVGTGSTNKVGTSAPSFEQTGPYTLNVPENSSAGQVVGVAVTADDADSRTLSYLFDGRDADLFDFNTSSGQIRTKRGVTYNHEDPKCSYIQNGDTKCTYFVTVVAFDRTGGSDALRVNIDVTDRTERPTAPAKPTVLPKANSRTSLDVKWSEPANTGPAITAYNVEYRPKGSTSDFSADGIPDTVTGTSTTISGTDSTNDNQPWLTAGKSYEVRVRAVSDEGISEWSPVGTGNTNAGNREPVFRDRNTDVNAVGTPAETTREVNENTASGRPVGRAVVADDGDGDTRTYKLVPADADDAASVAVAGKFEINKDSGQILTKASLTHEDGDCSYVERDDPPTMCTYTVKVEVGDGLDANRNEEEETAADDTITVVITVKDLPEPPSTPTVTVTSPVDVTTLAVTWEAANTGPTITGYDLRYREGSRPYSSDNCRETGTDNCSNIAADTTTTTIEGLTANTSYSVEVRARNAEGTSSWASAGSQRTNRNKETDTPNSVPGFGIVEPLTVNESEQSRQEVGSVLASDQDGGTLRYTLEGPHKNLFTIGSTTGLIQTSSKLNHEDPACDYIASSDAAGSPNTECEYEVRVKVVDGQGGSASAVVTISVVDQPEPPSAPSTPRVTATSGSGKSLDVTWNEPSNTGPSINDYDIQYREVGGSDDDWLDLTHDSTEREARIISLDPRKRYEVEVQATNFEGTSAWSSAGRGTTNASNIRPAFDDTASVVTLSVDENTGAGRPVGSPVSASDNDGNRLTYSLEGPGAASFTILSSGQIRTRSLLNHEAEECYYEDGTGSFCRYSVTVKVDDGQRKGNSSAAKSVTIDVVNVDELPSVPRPPTVMGVPGSTDSVRVTWDEPANTGPPITDYDVQYGVAGTGGFSTWTHQGVDRSTIITGLTSGTRYEVRVRAKNDEGTSEYSRSGTGSPNPDVANRNPGFSGGSRTFSVAENTGPGDPIGSPVDASDPDDDPLTYELEGADATSFDIDSGSGQIRTSAELNHEEKSRYSVTVRARDGRGGTSTVGVTINVTDVAEPPFAPSSPTVTTASSSSLQVTWDAPENTGPSITDYDYRYKALSDSLWTEVTNTTITGTTLPIEGLAASTFYDVEVRATNAEGTSEWSNPGIGSTAAPGANSPPVFDEGTSATRSVSATSPTGTPIGEPVDATDSDQGDTLTYSLEGRDQASFDIDTANGQLSTIAGVTLVAGTTYEVEVVASDGTDSSRIAVSIEATTGPPNRPPVFSEGASATRSVREDAAPGTSIGSPVRATDADTGDTRTYSLEGTDGASFSIVAASGQIQTLAALDASTKSTYAVTVRATDSRRGSATIAVTITVTARPTTFGCATRGAVSDASNVGLVADCEALLAARDNLDKLENGERILNWSARRTITDWDGVYLDGTPARVTRVILRRMDLNGTVPADLAGLPMLTELNLHTNRLTGSIPADLNGLRRLEKLLLHNNQLSGDIPNLSGLRSLEMLWLSGKDMGLTGGVPTWLNSMSGLESLSLWGNNLGDNGTRSIPNLTGMTSLSLLKLQSNNLTGGIPTWLGQMQSLRGLYIHANPLGGTIPRELGNLTRLRRIWLHSSNLTGTIPLELANMANLGTLNLRGNGLTGSIPTELGRLSGLQDLLLHDNQLTGGIPSVLGDLSSLRRLWLSENRLTGGIPTQLGGLPSLEQLNLHTNDLSGVIPSQLGNLGDTLTRLRLGAAEGSRGNTGLTGCVPRPLAGATDVGDLSRAGSAGLSICP